MNSNGLHRIRSKGKYGLITSLGEEVLRPEFLGMGEICPEGIVATKDGTGFGVIDSAGHFLVPPCYSSLGSGFSAGRLAAERNGKFGYIDPTGSIVIAFEFDSARHFVEDRAVVKANGLYGAIDLCGVVQVPIVYRSINFFQCERALVEVAGKAGYVSKFGEMAIEARYDRWTSRNFREGVASVVEGSEPKLIDIHGGIIECAKCCEIASAFDGVIRCKDNSERWGYIRSDGTPLLLGAYDWATDFSQGRALVCIEGTTFVVDDHLEKIAEVRCEMAYAFAEGFAKFELHNKEGMFDVEGNVVVPPDYDELSDFFGGLAEFRKGRRYGYVNTMGEIVWEDYD